MKEPAVPGQECPAQKERLPDPSLNSLTTAIYEPASSCPPFSSSSVQNRDPGSLSSALVGRLGPPRPFSSGAQPLGLVVPQQPWRAGSSTRSLPILFANRHLQPTIFDGLHIPRVQGYVEPR
jgi:hypothetical protein